MIQEHSVLAIIPARGGSKGILRKNIRMLAGKPLIAWTIEEAKKSHYIDRLILSSEDEEIIRVAGKWSCEAPFVRPPELATDDTPGIAPVLHALNTLKEKYDYVVLLQVTSPLRSAADIDRCIEICVQQKIPACVSVTEVAQNPYWMYEIDRAGFIAPFIQNKEEAPCRQSLPKVYIPNGAVYVSDVDSLMTAKSFLTPLTMAYVMPKDRSCDIDDEIDLNVCEIILNMRHS